MFDFLDWIGELVKAIWDLLVSVIGILVDSIMALLDMIVHFPQYVDLISDALWVLPPYASAAFLAASATTIAWIIIKRGPSQ